MGNLVNVEEFSRQSFGPSISTGSGRHIQPWTGVVQGSGKYTPGGDSLRLPTFERVVAVIVSPPFDGDTHVAWNADELDPKLLVLGKDGAEAKKGSDQSGVLRHVLVYVLA